MYICINFNSGTCLGQPGQFWGQQKVLNKIDPSYLSRCTCVINNLCDNFYKIIVTVVKTVYLNTAITQPSKMYMYTCTINSLIESLGNVHL